MFENLLKSIFSSDSISKESYLYGEKTFSTKEELSNNLLYLIEYANKNNISMKNLINTTIFNTEHLKYFISYVFGTNTRR